MSSTRRLMFWRAGRPVLPSIRTGAPHSSSIFRRAGSGLPEPLCTSTAPGKSRVPTIPLVGFTPQPTEKASLMTASFSTPPSARMTSPPARDTAMDNVVPYAGQGTVHRPPSASEDLAPTGLENPKTDHGGPLRSVGKPVFAVALGLALMVVAFANLDHLPALAQDFGTVWVYLVFSCTCRSVAVCSVGAQTHSSPNSGRSRTRRVVAGEACAPFRPHFTDHGDLHRGGAHGGGARGARDRTAGAADLRPDLLGRTGRGLRRGAGA